MKCQIPMEERHFIQMAQAALKISLRKRFDGMLFGDLAELADKASKYEELLREEQDVIQEGITAGRLKLAEKPPSVTTDPFPQPEVNMASLNWPEQKRNKLEMEASSSKRVTREAGQKTRAIISAGVVLCSRCKCETKLEVILDKQNQPAPSVFDRIGTSHQQSPALALSRSRTRQKGHLKNTQHSRRMTEQPKKEIPIRIPGSQIPLATIVEGRWYSVGKSGRPTLELTRTQRRRIQRQYCTFLKSEEGEQVLPEASSVGSKEVEQAKKVNKQRGFRSPAVLPQTEQIASSSRPSIHLTSFSSNQPETVHIQVKPKSISTEGEEDWFEDEQLDYEPYVESQNGISETKEQEVW
ncbi:unnamed protein product, partial [Prunus brigantina]